MARYEDFSCNTLRLGAGRGIPAAGTQSATEKNVSSLVTVTLTPVSVATVTVAAQTLTGIPGVEATDIVILVRHPIVNAVACTGVIANGANSISMTFVNPTAGALTPTSGAYTFLVIKTQ
jgi:hypothetical protein